jgi:hypothetical protein
MLGAFLPLIFCIGLAGGAIAAWRKAENKYQAQREKILDMANEIRTMRSRIRSLQTAENSGEPLEKSYHNAIKQIAIILDNVTNKTDEEKQIVKMIKREQSEIALELFKSQGTPQKRDINEAKAKFKNMKKEM